VNPNLKKTLGSSTNGRLGEIKTLKEKEHGQYTELKDEKAVLDLTT